MFNIAEVDNVVNENVKMLTAFICETVNAFNIDD